MAIHELVVEGFDATSARVGIVAAQFNADVTDPMLKHCVETLKKDFKVPAEHIMSVRVPGSADIPAVLSAMAQTGKYDALISIGAVVRGATAHFDYVSDLVTQGVRELQIKHAMPVAFGVIMCENQEQAKERIVLGKEFAAAAMHTLKAIEVVKG